MILHAAQLVRMAIIMNTKSAWDQYFVYLCFVITELKMIKYFLEDLIIISHSFDNNVFFSSLNNCVWV